MTIDKRLLTSFLMPPEWEVMGFNLKPFCLLHQMTLQAIESPFFVETEPCEVEDIIIAYRVCSGYDGIMSMKKPPTLKEKWFNARMTVSPAYCEKAITDFTAYVEQYCVQPKLWTKEKNDGEKQKERVPAQLLMASLLLRKTNISEQEVWRMPIGKMSWYCTALGYLEGADISVITTTDEEAMDTEKEELLRFTRSQELKHKLAKNK
jgi:hypothetical protein